MKNLLLPFMFLLMCLSAFSEGNPKYTVGFAKSKDTLQRSVADEKLWNITLTVSNNNIDTFKNYTVSILVDEDATTLPKGDYEFITKLSASSLKDLKDKSTPVRILIHTDKSSDKQLKDLKLVLKLEIKKKSDKGEMEDDEAGNNESTVTKIELIVTPADVPLPHYKFLGYLGTNFDLVDGVQAKNLFFATNIFIQETRKWGINLGLYGNRTMSKIDSISNNTFTSRIAAYGRDSLLYYRDSAMKITTQVSDNIGAYFTPLIPLRFLNDGDLKVYFAPRMEFIWRRKNFEWKYVNNATYKIDTVRNRFPVNTPLPLVTPLSFQTKLNVYDFYLGILGALIKYETDEISIRASGTFGVNFNYVPLGASQNAEEIRFVKNSRAFYSSHLWITEPTTGLTLGAEVSNFFGKYKEAPFYSKAQPYYNVTLSKAFMRCSNKYGHKSCYKLATVWNKKEAYKSVGSTMLRLRKKS